MQGFSDEESAKDVADALKAERVKIADELTEVIALSQPHTGTKGIVDVADYIERLRGE